MIASCWATAIASESIEPTLAATAASIGAATLALAATARDRRRDVGVGVHVDVDVEQVAVEQRRWCRSRRWRRPRRRRPRRSRRRSTPRDPVGHAAGVGHRAGRAVGHAADALGDRRRRRRRQRRRPGAGAPAASPASRSRGGVSGGRRCGAAAAAPSSTTSLPWSRSLSCSAVAMASPSMPWSIITPWSPSACAVEPSESMLAPTAASIGAATLALAATARSIGAATSSARSRSASRSRIETTSLSGSAAAPSDSSSSGVRPGCRRLSGRTSAASAPLHPQRSTLGAPGVSVSGADRVTQGGLEGIEALVQLVVRHGQRRGHPEHAAQCRELDDVHVQARARHSEVTRRPSSSAGALVSRSVTSSTPCIRPRPRTSPMHLVALGSSRSRLASSPPAPGHAPPGRRARSLRAP